MMNRFNQRGNIMLGLFGAIGLVATIGVVSMGVVKGPVRGMGAINDRTETQNAALAAANLIAQASVALPIETADCDQDGYVEPIPFKSSGAGLAPVGGGHIPDSVGASKTDGWRTSFGYCVWDPGEKNTDDNVAACGGGTANRLNGSGADEPAGTAIAVISAGPDKVFQSSCADWTSPTVPIINTPSDSDDIVRTISYAEFMVAGKGDAKLKELPDDACTPESTGIMRLYMGIVQVCVDTGWEEVGTSAQADNNFINVTNAPLSSTHTSNEIMFDGFLNTKSVSVTNGAVLLVNGVERSLPATIVSGDKISLRASAAPTPALPVSYTVSVGGVKRTWTITTRDYYPANLTITPPSAPAVTTMNVQGPGATAYGTPLTFLIRNTGEVATGVLNPATLSNTTNFEFTGIGDDCATQTLPPGGACQIEIRPKATVADDQRSIASSLTVTDGTTSAVLNTLSGFAKGWTCASPWNGTRIAHGGNVEAFNITGAATCNGTCTSQVRTCTADVLSGNASYQYQHCDQLAACTYSWTNPAWGACSASCGGGTQTRDVQCRRSDGTIVADGLCTTTQPSESQSCNPQACEIVKYIASNTTHVVLQNLFTGAEWSGSAPKRVVINSGVTVGSTSAATPALRTGTGWGGTLTLDNNGSIQGAGGQPNGGTGGTALLANASGLTLRNYGTIYAGGGAGGIGGTGGGGYYSASEGPYYSGGYTEWESNDRFRNTKIRWNGALVADVGSSPLYTVNAGGWTYNRGSYGGGGYFYSVSRSTTVYTSGGAGGNGGRGQGYDGGNAGGAGGGAPGANAGWGGTGGTGGGWGANGATGNTGASGNYSGGAGGGAGGAAGYAIQNRSYVTISVTGTMAGRT